MDGKGEKKKSLVLNGMKMESNELNGLKRRFHKMKSTGEV